MFQLARDLRDIVANDLIHHPIAYPYSYTQFFRPMTLKYALSIYVQQIGLVTPDLHLLPVIPFERADYNTACSVCKKTCKVCKSDEDRGHQTSVFSG